MVAADAVVFHVVVEGLVQGLGYRVFARRAALRLGVTGWARNRFDGAVEALLVGATADVEALIAELRRGPIGAEVTRLRVAPRAAAEGAGVAGFVIRSTA